MSLIRECRICHREKIIRNSLLCYDCVNAITAEIEAEKRLCRRLAKKFAGIFCDSKPRASDASQCRLCGKIYFHQTATISDLIMICPDCRTAIAKEEILQRQQDAKNKKAGIIVFK